jgi:hypothetical protein
MWNTYVSQEMILKLFSEKNRILYVSGKAEFCVRADDKMPCILDELCQQYMQQGSISCKLCLLESGTRFIFYLSCEVNVQSPRRVLQG